MVLSLSLHFRLWIWKKVWYPSPGTHAKVINPQPLATLRLPPLDDPPPRRRGPGRPAPPPATWPPPAKAEGWRGRPTAGRKGGEVASRQPMGWVCRLGPFFFLGCWFCLLVCAFWVESSFWAFGVVSTTPPLPGKRLLQRQKKWLQRRGPGERHHFGAFPILTHTHPFCSQVLGCSYMPRGGGRNTPVLAEFPESNKTMIIIMWTEPISHQVVVYPGRVSPIPVVDVDHPQLPSESWPNLKGRAK